AREVVRPDQDCRGLPHRGDVQRPRAVPREPSGERVGSLGGVEQVAILAGARREPRIERAGDLPCLSDRDLGCEPPVQEVADLGRGSGGLRLERCNLAPRMHARVCSSGDGQRHGSPYELLERRGEHALDRSDRRIALRGPPTEPGAVVREVEPDRSRNVHATEYAASVPLGTVGLWRSTFDQRRPATSRPSVRCSGTCTISPATWPGRPRPGGGSSATPTAPCSSQKIAASSRWAPPTCWSSPT